MFDSKNYNCAFAENVADFLYGEIATDDKAVFDAHLKTCRQCADELKSFGAVRASILDWRAFEFDRLETPTIEYKPIRPNAFETAVRTQSPFSSWRRLFTFAPAFAFAAVTLFLIVGIVLVARNFTESEPLAKVKNQPNNAQATVSSAESHNNQPAISVSDSNKNENKFDSETANSTGSKDETARNVGEPRIVKTANARRANVRVENLKVQKIYNSAANKAAFGSNQTVAHNELNTNLRRAPKLSGVEDEEDDASLRLSDLLDEDSGGK
jgi:hypothetical protein